MVIFPMKLRSTPRQFTLLALSSEGSLEGFTLSPEGSSLFRFHSFALIRKNPAF